MPDRLQPRPQDQKLYALTSLARPVDVRYPTNKALALLMPAVLLVGALISGLTDGFSGQSLLFGLRLAAVFFLSWALTRELLADVSAAAFVAGALGSAGFLWHPNASVLLLIAGLVPVRIVNRSVGVPATWLDLAVALVLGLGAMWKLQMPLLWLPIAVAFVLNGALVPVQRRSWLFALMAIAWGVTYDFMHPALMRELAFFTLPRWSYSLLAVVVVVIIAVAFSPSPKSACDARGEPLHKNRLRGALVVGLLTAAVPLFGGHYGLRLALPLWASVTVAASFGVGVRAMFQLRFSVRCV